MGPYSCTLLPASIPYSVETSALRCWPMVWTMAVIIVFISATSALRDAISPFSSLASTTPLPSLALLPLSPSLARLMGVKR